MSIQAGLVGLPNVGKSTLFNALTKSSVPAENYPFCTIDPHMAITEVPDERVEKLRSMYQSQKTIPSTVTFVDIAGLVKGAASGEGLGNQFLSHIREVNLILHVVRCFEDPDIIHSNNLVDPLTDYEIIISELMLKDLESVKKRQEKLNASIKACRNKPAELKELEEEAALLNAVDQLLENADAEKVYTLVANSTVQTIPLLTAKKSLVIANMAEDEIETFAQNAHYQELVARFGNDRVIPVSAKIEHELSQLEDEEAREMMSMLGLKRRGLDDIIKKTYQHLGLITFFTCGPKEIHAWPIKKGLTVRQAGGEIHSDLERGFICADVFNTADLLASGSLVKLKESGKMRTEGQDYLMQDGDVINIKFNV